MLLLRPISNRNLFIGMIAIPYGCMNVALSRSTIFCFGQVHVGTRFGDALLTTASPAVLRHTGFRCLRILKQGLRVICNLTSISDIDVFSPQVQADVSVRTNPVNE